MSPDDPRHGSYAGAVQHWFAKERPCEDCARAEWRYRKTRHLRHLRGEAPNVPSIGTVRRFRALIALGWTGPQIAEASGLSINSIRSISYHGSTVVRRETAMALADAYDRLSMIVPEGHYAERSRSIARRRGWAPPLAWDDIDDVDEQPTDWEYREQVDRAEVIREAVDTGAGISAVCARLGVNAASLQKWCGNHGLSEEYRVLSGREHRRQAYHNQHTAGRVA